MQKELKIGLAIGAVLLVVLIVYVAVPKGDPSTDVAQVPETAVDSGVEQSSQDTDSLAESAAKDDASQPSEQRTEQAAGDEVFGPSSGEPATADPDSASASGATDWANLLNNGAPITTVTPTSPPQLKATTTTGGTGGRVTGGGAAAPAEPAEATPANLDPTVDPAGVVGSSTANEPRSDSSSQAPPTQAERATSDEPAAPTATSARTHKVAPGESFAKIAKLIYKDERQYVAIQKANPDIDPAKLKPGQVINLPEISTDKATIASATVSGSGTTTDEPAVAEARLDPATQYKVKPGDSLYKIAQSVYGSSNQIDDIYELNKATIGPDSAKLKVGMVLKLPPNPNAQSAASR